MSRVSTVKAGQRCGRWTVIDAHLNWMALCVCDCGTQRSVKHHSLTDGVSRSCGCLKRDGEAKRHSNRRRGTGEYNSWLNMKTRCCNPRAPQFKDWGGRGITVCARWLDSFENFLADMGPKPSREHSIERRDNNAGYSKDNCVWATRREQGKNKRCNVTIELRGITRTVAEWGRELGIRPIVIYRRIYRGETNPELILTHP